MVSERFQEILQGLDAIVWEADPDTLRFSFVSGRAEELLGYPLEEWFERDFWADHIHPDDRERALAECRAATEAGRDHEFEYRSIAADGRDVWIRDIVTVSRGERGEVTALRGVMVDITKQRRAEADLRFQVQLLDQVDAAVVATDAQGRITHWNSHAEELFQRPQEEVLGHFAGELVMLPADRAAVAEIRAALQRGENVEDEFTLMRKDGSSFAAWVRAAPVLDLDGECAGFVAVCVDVTDRKRAQDELEQRTAQQAIVASLGQRALEGVGLTRLMDEVAFVLAEVLDADFTGLMELVPEENGFVMQAGAGWNPGLVRNLRVRHDHTSQAGYTVRHGDAVVVADLDEETRFEPHPVVRRHGVRSSVTVPIAGRGAAFGTLGAFSKRPAAFSADDVNFLKAVANVLAEAIERGRAEEETRHRALHDPLTNLPNRTLFLDRLEHALRIARRNEEGVAVFFLDLDQFKGINDTLGHHAGDELLLALAPRLMNALRPSDTVARFGGDEFVILCEDVRDREAATTLASRIAGVFERPFMIGGREHWITASIGIALAQTGSELPEDLIRDADAAMYGAKERGRARYEFYDERMRPRTLLRVQTEHDLRRAVERGELRLFYQPLVDLDSGRITDVEALIRWEHPERGMLAPGDFIPIAEASDLIVPIGKWVLEQAGRQAAKWRSRAQGDADGLRVSVNVSARQIRGEELVDTVEQVLLRHDLPGSALALELTESALMEEADSPTEVTTKIKALGVDLFLDDFGTGYSSLSYLQRFPIDKLKIDRSFIAGLDAAQTASIVTAVVNMAQALSLDVVAEGVETEAQLYALRSLGCRQGQGFLFARPMPADEIDHMLDVRWAEASAA